MFNLSRLSKVFDSNGKMIAVIVPSELWFEIERVISGNSLKSISQPEDISGFKELMQAWNFRYPYDPAVKCPHCGNATKDWRNKDEGSFFLVSASFGGLLVFKCHACGATVRHKYFKDHMTVEVSLPESVQA